jgi:predicted HTH domain antitoxin
MKVENSMELIESVENTVIISSECGHGLVLRKDDEPTKRCYKCGQYRPISDFNKNKKSKDGLQSECRECHAETMRKYHLKKAEEIKAMKAMNTTRTIKEEESKVQESKMIKVYSNVELAKFSPRQLMEELKARGFRWDYMLEPQRKIYFEKI